MRTLTAEDLVKKLNEEMDRAIVELNRENIRQAEMFAFRADVIEELLRDIGVDILAEDPEYRKKHYNFWIEMPEEWD